MLYEWKKLYKVIYCLDIEKYMYNKNLSPIEHWQK